MKARRLNKVSHRQLKRAIGDMVAAGQEDKRLAIMNGDIDKDGISLIAVVADPGQNGLTKVNLAQRLALLAYLD